MSFRLNYSRLQRVSLVCALLTFVSATGLPLQEREDERAKEMRQMWRNVINRRPRRQTKVTRPALSGPRADVNNQGARAGTQAVQSEPSEDVPEYEYKLASPVIPSQGQDIGLTIWRLRPSRSGDDAAAKQEIKSKRLKHNQSGTTNEVVYLTAERMDADTPLHKDDMVQLSVEVPQDGFLYVLNREQYVNEGKVTYGAPYLIFPTLRINRGHNRVGAGILTNIPALTDNPPFFSFERSVASHAGEEIILLVSPSPISELSGNADQVELTEEMFQDLRQWVAQTGRIDLVNGAGKAQTSEEAEAAKSSTTNGTKRLKHNSPPPQIVLRAARKSGEPFMVSIVLKIAP